MAYRKELLKENEMATYIANVQDEKLQVGDLVLGLATRHAGPIVRFEDYPNCPFGAARRAVFADGSKITIQPGGSRMHNERLPLNATLGTPERDDYWAA